jgi:hypothetical protein
MNKRIIAEAFGSLRFFDDPALDGAAEMREFAATPRQHHGAAETRAAVGFPGHFRNKRALLRG